jgi:hypothetical protein
MKLNSVRKNSEIEEEMGEASSEADDEAEDAQQIFKCLPEIGRPGRVLAQAYKVSHLTAGGLKHFAWPDPNS